VCRDSLLLQEHCLDKARYIRVRELARRLSKLRRTQAKQIDILCNDMVSAHEDFVERLRCLNFGIGFYESILGRGDMNSILEAAAGFIKTHVSNSNIIVFLCEPEGFNFHVFDEKKPVEVEYRKVESYFSHEVVEKISRANWACSLEDMYEMGLTGDLAVLNKISIAAVPIRQTGPGLGFVLIYRSSEQNLKSAELAPVVGVMSGLYKAMENCGYSAAVSKVD
jgi:hypothetical protein